MKSDPTSQNLDTPLGRRSNRFRTRSLEAAAVAVTASGAATSANAAIIYNSVVNASTGMTFSLDGTAAGEIEVRLGMMDLDLYLNANAANGSTVQLSVFESGSMPATNYLQSYSLGDQIDGVSSMFSTRGFMVDSPETNPNWAPGDLAYAGFTFNTGGTTVYGWLQIQFDATGTDFTVLQSAYEDSGAPIAVGAVPEPSTALLLGLGLVGLGTVARRRGRELLAERAS